jgi:HEAT repeat protein
LGKINDPRVVEPLIASLKDTDMLVRESAAEALGKINDPRAIEPLIAALTDSYYGVRHNAVVALSNINDPHAIDPLITALKDTDSDVRNSAAWALKDIKDPRAVSALMARNIQVAEIATNYTFFIRQGESGSEDVLIKALDMYGNKEMAEAFLNCGNSKLEHAARRWTTSHGFQIAATSDGGSVAWGSAR